MEEITLVINSLDGQSVQVSIDQEVSVEDLKQQIMLRTGVPAISQRLLYKGRVLKNDQLLTELSMYDCIYLVAKLQRRSFRRAQGISRDTYLEVLTQHMRVLDPLTQNAPLELYVGMWVDVKDTVQQWLEAQVVQIQNGKALIHYNGWPSRWDEWIDQDSPRIKPFRMFTCQSLVRGICSPAPSTDTVLLTPGVNEMDVVTANCAYLKFLAHVGKTSSRMTECRGYLEEHKHLIDRIGRFMQDFAQMINK